LFLVPVATEADQVKDHAALESGPVFDGQLHRSDNCFRVVCIDV
jgi:hypothetical protein